MAAGPGQHCNKPSQAKPASHLRRAGGRPGFPGLIECAARIHTRPRSLTYNCVQVNSINFWYPLPCPGNWLGCAHFHLTT